MKHKTLGQVYTPRWIVDLILDEVEYKGEKILEKRIIDPACGDGAFLTVIVERILNELKKKGSSFDEIKKTLEDKVYGIEIDREEYLKCINNLNLTVKKIINEELDIRWKVFNGNTLTHYKKFLNFFDFVVGNPPYIRVHNLDADTRKILKDNFRFSKGTIDIYVAFFELGVEMLKDNGILGYITPNSFLRNSSYEDFRMFLRKKRAVKTLIDFKSNKVFDGFATYTAITIISLNNQRDYFDYKELVNGEIKKINEIKYCDLTDKIWSFGSKSEVLFIKNIHKNTIYKVSDLFEVQYGFATLRDKIFIGSISKEEDGLVLFNDFWIEKNILRKIVKGSTYKGSEKQIQYIIFPYVKVNGKFIPMEEKQLQTQFPMAYKYLLLHKDELLKRNLEKNSVWYGFGRSQGLQNCHKEKIVVSPLLKDKINFYFLQEDVYVYSGIFITKKKKEYSFDLIKDILSSDEFKRYAMIKGKDLALSLIHI